MAEPVVKYVKVAQSGKSSYICIVNSTLKHSAILLLTLSILLSSVGVAFSEQFCLMTGLKGKATAVKMDGCCEKTPDTQAEEDSCCDVKVSYEKLEPVSASKAFSLELPALFPLQFNFFAPQTANFPAYEQRIYTYSDSSPPLYGRALLHSIHTLIV